LAIFFAILVLNKTPLAGTVHQGFRPRGTYVQPHVTK
jgi:hypothetical protein